MTSLLHVLNGDAVLEPLRAAGIPGEFTVWADVLHQGPLPAGLEGELLRELRAAHLAESFGLDRGDVLTRLRTWDAELDRWSAFDEVVFWLEHDLFDQLLLIRHLDWMHRIGAPAGRFSLICIGSHPAVPDFHGLGQLSPGQLAALLPSRRALTPVDVADGTRAWALVRADDPVALAGWLDAGGGRRLEFLPGALRRLLEEQPGPDGLSRSERQILRALAPGPATFDEIFRATQTMEERVFMGDASLRWLLDGLGRRREPLVESAGDRVRLSSAGARVLGL